MHRTGGVLSPGTRWVPSSDHKGVLPAFRPNGTTARASAAWCAGAWTESLRLVNVGYRDLVTGRALRQRFFRATQRKPGRDAKAGVCRMAGIAGSGQRKGGRQCGHDRRCAVADGAGGYPGDPAWRIRDQARSWPHYRGARAAVDDLAVARFLRLARRGGNRSLGPAAAAASPRRHGIELRDVGDDLDLVGRQPLEDEAGGCLRLGVEGAVVLPHLEVDDGDGRASSGTDLATEGCALAALSVVRRVGCALIGTISY